MMRKNDRSVRREQMMTMGAVPPMLVPTMRMIPFQDFQSISAAEIAKLDHQIEEFKHSRTITCPTSRLYFKMMIVLRERRRLATVDGNLLLGAELDTLIREISDFFLENELYVSKAEKVADIQNQYEVERARLDELEQKWISDLKVMTDQRDREEGRVADVTRTALETFDGSIPDTLPPEFTRLSSELLDLREKEKHLVGSRRFKEAAKLHAEFLVRQQQELVTRRAEFADHFENDRIQIERRNDRKNATIKADWNRKINHFKHLMNTELLPLRQGVQNLLEKLIVAKAEYIGEDDPIIREDDWLTPAKNSGNLFRTTKPVFTRGLLPRTMAASQRSIERQKVLMSTRRMAEAMRRQTWKLDGYRPAPPPPR
jgi:hypothetical protein